MPLLSSGAICTVKKLPPISVDNLRHTSAALAIRQGVDVKTVFSILGHYSAGFTLDPCTHVTGEMQKEAAGRMGDMLNFKS